MPEKYLLAYDIGTGGTKTTLVSVDGEVIGSTIKEYPVHYPQPGWAEQDPEDWWKAIVEGTREVLQRTGINPSDIAGISFDAQMINVIPVDEKGRPLRRSIIWLDARAGEESRELEEMVPVILMAKEGLLPMTSAKDVMPKILWIKKHEPKIFEKARKFVDCKDYIIFKMTGEFHIDWSCAFLTGMFNLYTKDWYDDILEYIGITRENLPKLAKTTDIVGTLTSEAAKELDLVEGIPIICGTGDIQATALGSGAVGIGEAHVYIGSSSWVCVHTSFDMYTLDAETGMGTILSGDPSKLILTGEMESSGACYKWFKENLAAEERIEAEKRNISVYRILDEEASKVPPGSDKLIFLPWMLGERAPLQDHTVRGGFINLSLRHTRAHMVRAILEGVAYHLRWIVDCMERLGFKIPQLNACGGGAMSPLWMQILADVINRPIRVIHKPLEGSSLGAAMIGAVGLGICKNFEEAADRFVKIEREYLPREENRAVYDELYEAFKEIYRRLYTLFYDLNE
ncbi:MAG: xylulokinase [Candidatus Baldrarchaeia archaeon]